MSNNWITSVYNLCIITAFIEHTHVKTEDICKVYGTVCSALIRADCHHMVTVDLKIFISTKQSLDKLISRGNCLKSAQRNRILYTRVMSIKCNNIVNTHPHKLLKCKGTVQRLTGSSLMLAALIEERHDYVDTASFSSDCSNDTLQVLIMIVR